MTPDQFQVVTALTIGSIGGILLLYFIVLKKKGWLSEEASSETSYLCPNKECRKIFQKPVQVKDLATSPPREYVACPHCGLDLDTVPMIKPQKNKTTEKTISLKEQLLVTKDQEWQVETPKADTLIEAKTSKIPEFKSTFDVKASVGLNRNTMSSEPKSQAQTIETGRETPSKPMEALQKPQEKEELHASPKGCTHFFGYVKRLPKSTPIPDECMWCPQLVKCLTGSEKIEA